MTFSSSDGIGNLRREKADSAPEIYGHTWEQSLEAGWRWHSDFPTESMEGAAVRLRSLQRRLGKFNVTFGQPWDIDKFKPGPIVGFVGLYVRDVPVQLVQFRLELESFNGF